MLTFWWHRWRGKTIGYRGRQEDPGPRSVTSLFRTSWRDVVWDRPRRGEQPSEEALQEFYRTWEWKRLRYKTGEKYGWRCLACNASRKDGAKIVIDHIRPIRRFWHLRLDPNNLQPLCNDCNQGKGSWSLTDFRTPNVRSRLAAAFLKTARTEIDSFVRDITFRGRKKVPEEDE